MGREASSAKFLNRVKGTVAWDFPPPFFSSKVPTLDPNSYPNFFRICFQICGVIDLKFDSPLHDTAGSQIFPQHYAAGSQISPLHFAAGSQISPLYDAAGSQVNDCCRNLPAAWCSGESNFPTAFCSGKSIHGDAISSFLIFADRNWAWKHQRLSGKFV